MGKLSEPEWDDLRAQVIGLGERSSRKSYYPELQRRLLDLERFRALLDGSSEFILLVELPDGKLSDATRAVVQRLGYSTDEFLQLDSREVMPANDIATLFESLATAGAGYETTIITHLVAKDRTQIPVEMHFRALQFQDGMFAVLFGRDITERIAAETAQNRYVQELRVLRLIAEAGIHAETEDDLISAVTELLAAELYQDHIGFLFIDDEQTFRFHSSYHGFSEIELRLPLMKGVIGEVMRTGKAKRVFDFRLQPEFYPAHDGLLSELCVPLRIDGEIAGVINAESTLADRFTQSDENLLLIAADQVGNAISRIRLHEAERRKSAELETLMRFTTSLRNTQTRALVMRVVLEEISRTFGALGVAIVSVHAERRMLQIHAAWGDWLYWQNRTISIGDHDLFPTKTPFILQIEETSDVTTFEMFRDVPSVAGVSLNVIGQPAGWLWIARTAPIGGHELKLMRAMADVAANALQRADLYDQTERQVRRLNALHDIDLAITASVDSRITLNVVLDNVVSLMNVDAADILTYNPFTHQLTYAAGKGFLTEGVARSVIRLDEDLTGKVAMSRKRVVVPDLPERSSEFKRAALLSGEGFISYVAAPLVARGQIKGVLDLYTRKPIRPDDDWIEFLDALAAQAAIAIESADLFTNLQRSNLELNSAYDATLESWAKTLGLREEGYPGHSMRVTQLADRFAAFLGAAPSELLNIHRGALLHDIGKLAIRDEVLFKPGPLTEEEWIIVRKHPAYAYELLRPISHLRGSVDIAWAHHEAWDGTGYPRGLKGEQIPWAARLVSVVDVYDALTHDQPYRKAWPKAEALKLLRDSSGVKFDPKMVDAFLNFISTQEE